MGTKPRKDPVKAKGLRRRIEKSVTAKPLASTVDGLDVDVLAHVNHFFKTPLPTMEKFSLQTPEDARQALVAIERTQKLLEERIRTVRVLKALCENAKKSENPV
jgi:hypothetical protein